LNCLKAAEVETLGDLVTYTKNDLMKFRNFGKKSLTELDDLLAQRDKINQELQQILDRQTDPWGVKIANVEIKHVDLPAEMTRAIARQAEAEREKRSKIIHADGELQASVALAQAAKQISAEPGALQLRFLQTLTEVAAEKNSTILFPLPIDLLKPFLNDSKRE